VSHISPPRSPNNRSAPPFSGARNPSRLPTSGPPLAVTTGFGWETRPLTLAPGEALIVPTDGLLELLGDDLDRLAAELQALAGSRDLRLSVEELSGETDALSDDVSLLVLRRDG